MHDLLNAVRKLRMEFVMSGVQILEAASLFQRDMAAGLKGLDSPLKMLPSFLARPTGEEKGTFLAIDFGGTNVRVMLVGLKGLGSYEIMAHRAFPLKDPAGGFDFTSENTDAGQLFDFIAENIAEMAPPGSACPLGHTFSFPTLQLGVNRAVLIKWTKEIRMPGMEGRDVNQKLAESLKKLGLGHVVPVAVINDTVGALLAAAYQNPGADIGSICGTGHNTCYIEPCPPADGGEMIINIESGNFDKLRFTKYDISLDEASERPGEQRLEKMVSGQYLGRLAQAIIQDFIDRGLIFKGNEHRLFKTFTLRTEDISLLLADQSRGLSNVAGWIRSALGIDSLLEERVALRTIASIVVTRSAQLVASTFAGILKHIDPELSGVHVIAVDGSLYELTPGYSRMLQATLNNVAERDFSIIGVKNGSGVGAAVAAAIAVQEVPKYNL